MNKSLLKWAGNKFRVLPHLIPHVGYPNRFCEPFAGSLSVSLNVQAEEYILNDINKDLIYIYQNLTNPNDDNFIKYCEELFVPENNDKDVYLELRSYFNKSTDPLERARLFIYLNRHCFNGLSRYNKKGEFNVPFGKYDKPSCPSNEMQQFRSLFLNKKSVKFTSVSFEDEMLYENLTGGDVVYFDPPYIPISETSNFTDYATEGFTHQQQVELAELCDSLANRGVKVILSNHDVPVARELYKNATIHSIQVSRTISAKGSSRKKVSEIVAVWNK
jgi:DNA adenine methylase